MSLVLEQPLSLESPYQHYNAQFSEVPGWFSQNAIALWDSLLSFQGNAGITGNFLEIGVWKGRSAALSTLHARPDEAIVLVDLMPLTEAQQHVEKIRTENVHYLVMNSADLLARSVLSGADRTFRWIHIDGEHSGPAVIQDLHTAMTLLNDDGVIVLDDFFNPIYPQVTRAAMQFVEQRPLELTMFLCGFNKAYLCRPRAARVYLSYLKSRLYEDMTSRGCEVTVFKTTDSADMNCFGIGAPMRDFAYRGPDWDQKSITI